MPVARVPNLPSLLKELKEEGVWVFGTAAGGTTQLYQADLKGPAAIVIGSEGDGMGRLVAENCDFTVSIPMFGKINSLNASAARCPSCFTRRCVSAWADNAPAAPRGQRHRIPISHITEE